ncbi:MAG: hypothetical protein V3S29_13470, partial [bacterium]
MKLSAERIRSAKPEPPPLPPGFSRRVMDELERRGLLVKPARAVAIPPWLRLAAGALLLAVGVL